MGRLDILENNENRVESAVKAISLFTEESAETLTNEDLSFLVQHSPRGKILVLCAEYSGFLCDLKTRLESEKSIRSNLKNQRFVGIDFKIADPTKINTVIEGMAKSFQMVMDEGAYL